MDYDIGCGLRIDAGDIEESFLRASGPGGQNVNKLSTAVRLRFDLAGARLPAPVKARLARLAGRRLGADGSIVILAQRFRTQERNRADALERLLSMAREAAIAPIRRVATRPTLASKRRRLEGKTLRAGVKAARQRPDPQD